MAEIPILLSAPFGHMVYTNKSNKTREANPKMWEMSVCVLFFPKLDDYYMLSKR